MRERFTALQDTQKKRLAHRLMLRQILFRDLVPITPRNATNFFHLLRRFSVGRMG
jgi:hypothetical protein